MAIVLDGPVTPDALTAFVREVPTPSIHRLAGLLPDRLIGDIEVNFDELTRTNRTAHFRAWDSRIPYTRRDAPTTRRAKMPPLSVRNMVGELERVQIERARFGGNSLTPMIDAIYNDATTLVTEVRNRMELARGDVLTDGKLTLTNENGLTMEADFGVPGNHLVTAGTLWSSVGSATVVSDMASWVATYTATNGAPPGGFVTSTAVLNYMLQNAEMRTLAGSLSGTPTLVSRGAFDNVLSNFGLPPLKFVYDTQVNVDGTDTRITPADRVYFVPANPSDLGFTAWGITATGLELVNAAAVDLAFSDAPGIVGVVEKSGPPYRQETFVDAVGMPILAQPKRLFVADVA